MTDTAGPSAGLVDAQVHLGGGRYRELPAYLAAMDADGVDQAVLVQRHGSTDNTHLAAAAALHPDRFVAVGAVDETSADAAADVHALACSAGYVGVRVTASARADGAEPLALWYQLDADDLSATVRGTFDEITADSFTDLLDTFPTVPVLLEHLGGFHYGHEGFDRFLALAGRPNVHTMWSCFYRYSSEPFPHHDADPYLRDSLAAFTADRIMWSGDWNRFELGHADQPEDYRRALQHVMDLPFLDDADRAAVLEDTARSFYQLPDPARPGHSRTRTRSRTLIHQPPQLAPCRRNRHPDA